MKKFSSIIIFILIILVTLTIYSYFISQKFIQNAIETEKRIEVIKQDIKRIEQNYEAEKKRWLEEQQKKSVPKKSVPQETTLRKSNNPSIDEIIKAMCLVESDNRPHIRGRGGERGILQLKYNEWRQGCKLLDVKWSWDEAFNREKNIAVGTAYLQYLIKKYGDWQISIKIYHSGERGVIKLGRGDKYLWMVNMALETGHTQWRLTRK